MALGLAASLHEAEYGLGLFFTVPFLSFGLVLLAIPALATRQVTPPALVVIAWSILLLGIGLLVLSLFAWLRIFGV